MVGDCHDISFITVIMNHKLLEIIYLSFFANFSFSLQWKEYGYMIFQIIMSWLEVWACLWVEEVFEKIFFTSFLFLGCKMECIVKTYNKVDSTPRVVQSRGTLSDKFRYDPFYYIQKQIQWLWCLFISIKIFIFRGDIRLELTKEFVLFHLNSVWILQAFVNE